MSTSQPILPVFEFTSKPPIFPDVQEAWRYRWMAVALTRRNLMTRYTQTMLGPAWFILQPIMLTGVLTVVMSAILGAPSDGMPYVVFAASGTILWTTFNRSLTETGTSLVTMGSIFSKVYFPRILVPIAALMTSAVEFLPVYVLLLLLVWAYGLFSGWLILWFPVFVMLTLVLSFGLGLWLTVLTPTSAMCGWCCHSCCSSYSTFRRSSTDRRQCRRSGGRFSRSIPSRVCWTDSAGRWSLARRCRPDLRCYG